MGRSINTLQGLPNLSIQEGKEAQTEVEFLPVGDGEALKAKIEEVLHLDDEGKEAVFAETGLLSDKNPIIIDGSNGGLVTKPEVTDIHGVSMNWREFGQTQPESSTVVLQGNDLFGVQNFSYPDGSPGQSLIVVHYKNPDAGRVDYSKVVRFTKYPTK